jgi:hypothetical protein
MANLNAATPDANVPHSTTSQSTAPKISNAHVNTHTNNIKLIKEHANPAPAKTSVPLGPAHADRNSTSIRQSHRLNK